MNSKRVKWVERAYFILREEFIQEAPKDITITAGFPRRKKAIGECCFKYISNTKNHKKQHLITIHFQQFRDPIEVLHVLLHEMIHASGIKGHRKDFSQIARRVGLIKPWVSTTPSEYLKELLFDIVNQKLGPLPDGWGQAEAIEMPQPQTTRLRKWKCGCGVIVRVARDNFHAQCLLCNGIFSFAV